MKKSQLKNIIRESIKGLVNEQGGSYTRVNARVCNGSLTLGGLCVPTGVQIGDVYQVPNASGQSRKVFVRDILGSCPQHLYNHYGQPFQVPQPTNCPLCCDASGPGGSGWIQYSSQAGGACWVIGCGNASSGCTQQDFTTSSSPCGTTHLSHQSYQNWLNLRWNGYNNIGCQHLQSVINWITQQLASGVTGQGTPLTPLQITRKNAKIDWAGCMQTKCGC